MLPNDLPDPESEDRLRGVAGRDGIGVNSTLTAFASLNVLCALYPHPHCRYNPEAAM